MDEEVREILSSILGEDIGYEEILEVIPGEDAETFINELLGDCSTPDTNSCDNLVSEEAVPSTSSDAGERDNEPLPSTSGLNGNINSSLVDDSGKYNLEESDEERETRHLVRKQVTCQGCGGSFSKASNLKRHCERGACGKRSTSGKQRRLDKKVSKVYNILKLKLS